MPSVFTMKLRKLLRTKRLEYAQQKAFDRLLVLSFGTGDATIKVILEFYAAVNRYFVFVFLKCVFFFFVCYFI